MNDAAYEALRSEVLAVRDDLAGADLTEALRRILGTCARELSGVCTVVVCGEFGRGKSSLLNALVERPGLFPVDIDVTTSVVTELRWADHETATVFAGDPAGEDLAPVSQEIPVDRIADYVTERGNPGNAKDVRLVRIGAPIEGLGRRLVLVDTPGIGSLNIAHATATYASLSKADAVLFVGAADERMSTAELAYLKDAMDKCPVVITVLSRIDKLFDPGPEVEVAVARERIADATGRPPDEVTVVGVSSLRKRVGLASGDQHRIDRSGFPELEDLLSRRLAATWGAARLRCCLDVLDDVVTALAAPPSNELTALAGADRLEAVRAELAAARAEVDRLAAESADWRGDLAERFRAAAGRVGEQLADDCARILYIFRTRCDSDAALDDPNALVRETAESLVDALDQAYARMEEAAEDAAAVVSRHTSLRIAVRPSPAPDFEVSVTVPDVELETPPTRGRLKSMFTSAAAYGTAGMTLGGTIGGLVAPGATSAAGAVGGLLGNIVGLFAGLRDHAEKARQEQRGNRALLLESLVLPVLEHSADRARGTFDHAVEARLDELLRRFTEGIAATRDSLRESILALDDLRSATERERDLRRAELEGRLSRLEATRRRIDELRARTNALG